MKVRRNETPSITGVPDYYEIYQKWCAHYAKTGEERSRTMSFHYARLAEEMDQALIEDDETDEVIYSRNFHRN